MRIGENCDRDQKNSPEISQYIERNKSVLALIALFTGLSGFILNVTKGNPSDSLIYGIISLFFLIGLLIAFIGYDAVKTLNRLFQLPGEDLISAIQCVFIFLFTTFLLIPLFSLMDYFSMIYPDKVTSLLIGVFICIIIFLSVVVNSWIYSTARKHDKLKLFIFPFFAIGSMALIFINKGTGIPQLLNYTFPNQNQGLLIYSILVAYFLYSAIYFLRRKD